jgi:hypothetical protein
VAKSSQEVPSRKSLYLLASQLKLAVEVSDAVSEEDLRHYLQSLQKEFLTSFVPPENLVDVVNNEEVSEESESEGGTPFSSRGTSNDQNHSIVQQSSQNEHHHNEGNSESPDRIASQSRYPNTDIQVDESIQFEIQNSPEALNNDEKSSHVISLIIGSTKSGGDPQTSSTLKRKRVDGYELANESEDL